MTAALKRFGFLLLLAVASVATGARGAEPSCARLSHLRWEFTVSAPTAYAAALMCKQPLDKVRVDGLIGRVLKGKTSEDFRTLSYDPDRKVIFFMGSDGLQGILGLDGGRILTKIGYTPDYIDRLKRTGYHFKLVIFRERAADALPATWDNVERLVETAYPGIAPKVRARLSELKALPFASIERQGPAPFAAVDKVGRSHPDYVDEEKLLGDTGTLYEVRAFLYYQLRLMDLFSGDGVTRTADGSPGLKEYIGTNKPLDSLKDPVVVDLDGF